MTYKPSALVDFLFGDIFFLSLLSIFVIDLVIKRYKKDKLADYIGLIVFCGGLLYFNAFFNEGITIYLHLLNSITGITLKYSYIYKYVLFFLAGITYKKFMGKYRMREESLPIFDFIIISIIAAFFIILITFLVAIIKSLIK